MLIQSIFVVSEYRSSAEIDWEDMRCVERSPYESETSDALRTIEQELPFKKQDREVVTVIETPSRVDVICK